MFVDELINEKELYQYKQAIVCHDDIISYQDLKLNINFMGQLLLQNEVSRHDNVIIYMNKSIEYIISIFGILSVGAAYVPIDNNMPWDRFSYIAKNCGCNVIITDSESIANIKMSNVKYIVIDKYYEKSSMSGHNMTPWNPEMEVQSYDIKDRSVKDIAYIIYTSGSTGTPKGVMVRHDSVVAFVQSIIDKIGYSSQTKYLNVSPLYFDASIVDLFCTLYMGGTLVLMKRFVLPNKLLKTLVEYQITDTLLVSSILKLLASKFVDLSKFDLSHLRTIWYGAESCPIKVIRTIKKDLQHVKFIHGYGPTEATHTTTMLVFDEVPESEAGFMPIGKPLPNVDVLVLNEKNEPIKTNEVGMLYVGGLQLFEGYCNDPIKNQEFIIDDFLHTGRRYYKTNDMVTIDRDGNYVYIGRSDDMVKIAGKLVYINEVESVLLKCREISDAIVITVDDEFFAKKLICFIVFNKNSSGNLESIMSFAKQKLQSYMIPSNFYVLEEDDIPRNANDKVDRRSLEKLISKLN